MPDLEMPRVIRSALSRAWRVVWAMLLAAVLLPAAGALGQATPPPARSFVWDQVDVTVELREDSSFHLTERNAVDFTGGPFRTGYREIPLARIEGFDHVRVGEVEGAYVKPYRFVAPGEFPRETPNTYTWQEVGPNLRIEWSIPETTSETRTFQLEYDAFGALRVYDDAEPPYQQITWIGVDEALTETAPVNEASLTFVLPWPIDLDQAVVRGPGGNRPADHTDDGQTWVWRANALGPGDSLEAALRFPPLVDAVAPVWQEESDRPEAGGAELPGATPVPSGTPVAQATPVAGPVDFPPCREVMANDFPGRRCQLIADCVTDRPIFVPESWVFDGGGHTIYARDPEGGRLTGGVVTVSGDGSTVRNLTVDGSGLSAPCLVDNGRSALGGVVFWGGSGGASEVTVRNLRRPLSPDVDTDAAVSVRESCGQGIAVLFEEAEVFATDNAIANVGYVGILVEAGTASLSRNVIDGAADTGILALTGANVRVSPGNSIRNGRIGIQIENSSGRVAGNTIEAMERAGIVINVGGRASVAGNVVLNAGRSGIAIEGSASHATVENNEVDDADVGIMVIQGSADVRGNTVTDAEDGIVVTAGGGATISDGNRVRGGERGINVAGSGTSATVTGNSVEEAGVVGISINQGAAAPDVSGNTVSDARFGIVTLGTGTTSTVADNTVSNLSGSGFTIEDGATAKLRGNHVSDAGWGVIVTSTGTTAELSENRIERLTTGGISVNNGARATVVGNTLLRPGANGIETDGAAHVHLEGNTIEDASGSGIRLERSRPFPTTGDSVELVSRDIYYEPSEITIPADTDVTLILPNEGVAAHNVTIEELGIDVDLAPGQTEEVVVNAPAGTFEIFCNVPGHREAGHIATLLVAPGAEAGDDGDPVEPDVIRDNKISGGKNGIVVTGSGATAEVMANSIAEPSGTGVAIADGATATVENNTVNEAGLGIYVVGAGSTATLTGNRITDPVERGIKVQGGAEATLHKNVVMRAGTMGIYVDGQGTTATLMGNVVSDAADEGIKVERAATATIVDGNFVSGGKWGIAILSDGTTAEVRGNRVRDAINQGISVAYGAHAVIADNTIHGGISGIYVRHPGSRAVITGNFVDAEERGIYIWEEATAERIEDNTVTGGASGIVVEGGGATGLVVANRVTDVSDDGIAVIAGASATIDSNSVQGGDTGIAVKNDGSAAIITGNLVAAERQGIFVWYGATAERIEDNVVTGGRSGIAITGPGVKATVTGNEISNVPGLGITFSGAVGAVTGNTLTDVTNTGIRVINATAPMTVSGNTLRNAGSIGIEALSGELTIADNAIEGSQRVGIYVNNLVKAQVTGNSLVGPDEPDANEPGPYGVQASRAAHGRVTGNAITGFRNANPEQTGCGIFINAAAPDVVVAGNLFPAPGNEVDVCDERLSAAAATPTPAATPVAAAPCLDAAELGPNVAVVTTRTTILQKSPTDAGPPRPIIARGTRLLVAPAITMSGSGAEDGACGWIPVVVVETGQPGFVPAEHVQLADASDAAAP